MHWEGGHGGGFDAVDCKLEAVAATYCISLHARPTSWLVSVTPSGRPHAPASFLSPCHPVTRPCVPWGCLSRMSAALSMASTGALLSPGSRSGYSTPMLSPRGSPSPRKRRVAPLWGLSAPDEALLGMLSPVDPGTLVPGPTVPASAKAQQEAPASGPQRSPTRDSAGWLLQRKLWGLLHQMGGGRVTRAFAVHE